MMVDREELLEEARLLATPIDFDLLVAEGVLEKHGSWYAVTDWQRLPKHARKRAYAMKVGTKSRPLVKFTSESERQKAAQLVQQFAGLSV